jgi:hypothetical protein
LPLALIPSLRYGPPVPSLHAIASAVEAGALPLGAMAAVATGACASMAAVALLVDIVRRAVFGKARAPRERGVAASD